MRYNHHLLWAAALLTGLTLTLHDPRGSGTATTHPCDWTCMLLTLQWPGSFCIGLNNKTICTIPQTLQNWTIHGLWPMHAGRCCNCWPIFHSHLQEIESDLTELWPSLIKTKPSFCFWKDEWIKHGTCAGCEESVGSPPLYFQAAVKLRKLFDVDGALETSGIRTSCDVSYKYDDIHNVLFQLLGNNYDIQCLTDRKGREVWLQLKIHFSRNQTLGCPKQEEQREKPGVGAWFNSPGHPCPKNTTIFYVPINYENPHEPCN